MQIHIDASLPQRKILKFKIVRMRQFFPARRLLFACSSNILSIIEWNPARIHERITLRLSSTIFDRSFAENDFVAAAIDQQNPFFSNEI
jgi:hypothetical protein